MTTFHKGTCLEDFQDFFRGDVESALEYIAILKPEAYDGIKDLSNEEIVQCLWEIVQDLNNPENEDPHWKWDGQSNVIHVETR